MPRSLMQVCRASNLSAKVGLAAPAAGSVKLAATAMPTTITAIFLI